MNRVLHALLSSFFSGTVHSCTSSQDTPLIPGAFRNLDLITTRNTKWLEHFSEARWKTGIDRYRNYHSRYSFSMEPSGATTLRTVVPILQYPKLNPPKCSHAPCMNRRTLEDLLKNHRVRKPFSVNNVNTFSILPEESGDDGGTSQVSGYPWVAERYNSSRHKTKRDDGLDGVMAFINGEVATLPEGVYSPPPVPPDRTERLNELVGPVTAKHIEQNNLAPDFVPGAGDWRTEYIQDMDVVRRQHPACDWVRPVIKALQEIKGFSISYSTIRLLTIADRPADYFAAFTLPLVALDSQQTSLVIGVVSNLANEITSCFSRVGHTFRNYVSDTTTNRIDSVDSLSVVDRFWSLVQRTKSWEVATLIAAVALGVLCRSDLTNVGTYIVLVRDKLVANAHVLSTSTTWWDFLTNASKIVTEMYEAIKTGSLTSMVSGSDFKEFRKKSREFLALEGPYSTLDHKKQRDYVLQLEDLITQGEKIYKHTTLMKPVRTAANFFTGSLFPTSSEMVHTTLLELQKKQKEVGDHLSVCDSRRCPFGVMLYGQPGVGKTALNEALISHFGALLSLPIESRYRYVKTSSGEDSFWSGFKMSQWAVTFDDVGSVHPNKQPTGDKNVSDIIAVVNNTPFITPQPDLSGKGAVACLAEYFSVTTNVMHLNAHTTVQTPAAVMRRFRVTVEPFVKPQFCIAGQSNLDPDKARQWTLQHPDELFPDFWTFNVYRTQLLDVPTDAMGNPSSSGSRSTNPNSGLGYSFELVEFEGQQLRGVGREIFLRYWTEQVLIHDKEQTCGAGQRRAYALCEHKLPLGVCSTCGSTVAPFESQCDFGDAALHSYVHTMLLTFLCGYITLISFWCAHQVWSFKQRYLPWIHRSRSCIALCRSYYASLTDHCTSFVDYVHGVRFNRWMRWQSYSFVTENHRMLLALGAMSALGGIWALLARGNDTEQQVDMAFTTWTPPSRQEPVVVLGTQQAASSTVRSHREPHISRVCDAMRHIRFEKDTLYQNGVGVMLQGNVCMTVAHVVPRDKGRWTVRVAPANTSNVENERRVQIFDIDTSKIFFDREYAFFYVPGPSARDLTPYFCKPGTTHGAPTWIIDGKPGSNCAIVQAGRTTCETVPIPLTASPPREYGVAWRGTLQCDLQSGSSGSPVLCENSNMAVLIGLHEGREKVGLLSPTHLNIVYPITRPQVVQGVAECMRLNTLTNASGEYTQDLLLGLCTKGYEQPYIAPHETMTQELDHKFVGCHLDKRMAGEEPIGEARYAYVGSLGRQTVAFRSKVTIGEDWPYWESIGKTCEKVIPSVAPNRKWEPTRKAFIASVTYRDCNMDPGVLHFCASDYLVTTLTTLEGTELAQLKPVPLDVAIKGEPGVKFLDAINYTSGAGHGYTGKKGCLIFPSDQPFEKKQSEVFYERVAELSHTYLSGHAAGAIFDAALKDEPKKEEKAIRQFVMSAADATVVGRKFLVRLCTVMQRNPFVFETGVGSNAKSSCWHAMAMYLRAHGGDSRIGAGDYKNFDKCLRSTILDKVRLVIHGLCVASKNYSVEELGAVAALLADIINPVVNIDGTLVQFFGMNPSGNFLTVHINGIANCILLRYVFYVKSQQLDRSYELGDFKRNVALLTYGDDNIFGTTEECRHVLNQNTAAEILGSVNITYTDANKNTVFPDFIGLWDDASFLKRTWKRVPVARQSIVTAPLELASLSKMLKFVRHSLYADRYQTILDKHMSYLDESAHHGELQYNQAVSEVKDCWQWMVANLDSEVMTGLALPTIPDYGVLVATYFLSSALVHDYTEEEFAVNMRALSTIPPMGVPVVEGQVFEH